MFAAEPAPLFVVVMESRPGADGRSLASRLAVRGIDASPVPDAAAAWAMEKFRVELALVGADTVLSSGDVVDKVGTRPADLAARDAGVLFLAAVGGAKIAVERWSWSASLEGDVASFGLDGDQMPEPRRESKLEPGAQPEPATNGGAV